MIFVVSGEGPSDIGSSSHDHTLKPGPMAHFIDQVVQDKLDYSPIEATTMVIISESVLADASKEISSGKKGVTLPGDKSKKETAYFFRNARALAKIALDKAAEDAVAVLFRDADGTASSGRGLWSDKVSSIENGFRAEGLRRGVAMVPKPKSEAWLICALKDQPYQHCGNLENRSGNDKSPKSLKKELEELLGGEFDLGEVINQIENRKIDYRKIAMPSLTSFLKNICEAIDR
ncbi:hypothetical protein [Thalassospira sp. CH_XMU1458]|uniref:hypothetical protein n=1 Tax=Thalassospira sp. CH_XMU1458 TaxID=3107776 RepID=UPI00300CB286